MKKILAILIGCFLISILGMTASAESITDSTGDVFHWIGSNYMDWSWDVDDKPDIDIIEIGYTPGNKLTISLKVAGSIKNEKSWYHIWFNTSDAYYHLSFVPDDESEPFATAFPLNFDQMSLDDLMNYTEPTVETSVNGNTISATIDWVTDSQEMTEFWATAQQWENEGDAWSDYYIDFAPNDYSYFGNYEDYHGEGNDSGDNGSDDSGSTGSDESSGDTTTPPPSGTPGFELLTLIAALGVTFILLRRRH